MSTTQCNMSPPLSRLAMRLEQDIRSRGLRQGDKYLSTAEAGRMLGVSTARAHRVLQMLAQRKVVERRDRSGTYVGPEAGPPETAEIHLVYIIAPPEKRRHWASLFASTLNGLAETLPRANVQFTMLPGGDRLAFLDRLLQLGQDKREVSGVIASSCPSEVYWHLAKSSVPTVVSGTLPLDGPDLASVTMDDYETGRLLTEYLLDRGHRRIGLLATTLDRPGDKLFFRGINEALSAAPLPPNALVFEVAEDNPSAISAAMHHLLGLENPPTSILARRCALAELAQEAATGLDKKVPDDLEVVFGDYATKHVSASPFPHVQTVMDHNEIMMTMGRMLKQLALGKRLSEQRVVMPVEFRRAD